jgi:acetyltransferase-like isoleucine patch superfamily enzyme
MGVERSFAVSGGCYFQAGNGIEIGDGTIFGPAVRMISADHDMTNGAMWKPARPIRIGRNCWIGASAIILPGVELGDRVVIGAGAVVTRDVPAGSVAVGNPARVIGNS